MKNLKVSMKITLLIVLSILFMIGIGAQGYLTTVFMSNASDTLFNGNLKLSNEVAKMRIDTRATEAAMLELMLTTDEARNAELTKTINDRTQQITQKAVELSKYQLNEIEKQLLTQYEDLLPEFQKQSETLVSLAVANRNQEAYELFISKISELRLKMNNLLTDMTENVEQTAEELNHGNQSAMSFIKTLTFLLISAAVVLFAFMGWYMARLITKPLAALQEYMERAEQGDLTAEGTYESRDEIGRLTTSYNRMAAGLRTLIAQVSDKAVTLSASSEELTASAEQTVRASEQIAAASGELASGLDQQVLSVQTAAGSVQLLNTRVVDIEQSGSEVNTLVGGAAEAVDQGVQAVRSIFTQMEQIDQSVGVTQERITSLGGKTEQIGTFVTTINEIASQTNLLALNASIEAARAGDAGRGFAVVAEEIRKLADATSQSSEQIADIISAVQAESRQAVESMNHGAERVKQGVQQSQQVSDAFQQIEQAIQTVQQKTRSVILSIGQVAGESRGITSAMEQVSSVTEQGATSVQQTSAASEEQLSTMEEVASSARFLSDLAEELQESLSRFKV